MSDENEKDKYSQRQILREIQKEQSQISSMFASFMSETKIHREYMKEESNTQKNNIAALKKEHYELKSEYKTDKAKVYGIGAAIAAIFGTVGAYIKHIIFGTN